MFCSLHELLAQCTDIRKKLMLHVQIVQKNQKKKKKKEKDFAKVEFISSTTQTGIFSALANM